MTTQHDERAELMRHMVNRFLTWKLPQNFHPDSFISFEREKHDAWGGYPKSWPTGTNLFTAEQAQQMLEYLMDGYDPAALLAADAQAGGEVALWVSPGQFEELKADPEDEAGTYLPVRHTTRGKFTMPLYTHPHPQPQAVAQGWKLPSGTKVVDKGFRWVSEEQHHVPQIVVEFDPVPANSPCDAKGWADRDQVAAMLSASPSATTQRILK